MGLRELFNRSKDSGKTDNSNSESTDNSNINDAVKEISKYYTVGELTPEDCDSCSVCYPKSLKVDDAPLFNTAPPVSGQIIVATAQNNWNHDIGTEDTDWGRVCQTLGNASEKFEEILGGKVRINASDLDYDDAESAHKVSVTVLPQFVRILTTPETCIQDVCEVFKLKPEDELSPNMMSVPERGYILLCSHSTRDKRCGVTAPHMKRALNDELRDRELYRDPDDDERGGIRVVLVNHVGGHKFAANALIYQRNGMAIMLARLRPEHCKALVEKTIENGVIVPEYIRFVNKVPAYSW